MADYDFTDINKVLVMVAESQDYERDQRNQCREAKLFITKRDGQWDPYAWQKLEGRFRGTFDMCTPIIDNIAGEIEQSDFTLRVSPAGGEATEDTARTYDGLIRNIRNMSNAEDVFQQAGRSNVIQGFSAWEVVQEYADTDSFDQDLLIRAIPDAVDSVWFDPNSMMQTREDARWATVLTQLTKREYDKLYPEGSGMSIGDDRQSEAYWEKTDHIIIGRLLYKKKSQIDLVRMSDGSVYEDDEDFKKIQDELAQRGITEDRRRKKDVMRVYSRIYDGSQWLSEEEETVFNLIPIVPIYGNFDIVEHKLTYSGKLEKLYDQQRSLNYLISRDIEDGALSPSPTVWMTEAMAEGHDYSRMNIDKKGVRYFNVDDENPNLTPQYTGGPQSSPGMQTSIGNMQQMIGATANIFNAQQGNASPTQSGVAGAQQIDQGNIGSIKWFKSLEVGICYTGKVLIDALPRVYDSTRQIRVVGEDGTGKMVTLNESIIDEQTGEAVTINDLSQGKYDAVCNVGPAFNNQQKESAQAFLDAAAIDPTVLQTNMDLWLRSQETPIMKDAAARARQQLFNAGVIPEDQWSDEERELVAQQQAAAAQQPPAEDPNMVLAKAEELKGQAQVTDAQTKQLETQANMQLKQTDQQIKMAEINLKQQEFERAGQAKFNTDLIKAEQNQQQIDLSAQQQAFNQQQETMKAMLTAVQQQQDSFSQAVNDLKVLREAMGVDSIVGPTNTEAYIEQSEIVTEKQENQDAT